MDPFKELLFLLFISTCSFSIHAQQPCVAYGTPGNYEYSQTIIKLSNGNYAIGSVAGNDGINLVITSPSLDMLVSKKYPRLSSPNASLSILDILETRDSNLYLLVFDGHYNSLTIKTDLQGQIIWAKSILPPGAVILSGIQSPVSGVFNCVGYYYNDNLDRYEWLLMRFNESGDLTSVYSIVTPQQNDRFGGAIDLLRTPDGGLLIGGTVVDQAGERNAGMVKLSSFLTLHWAKRFGVPGNHERIYCLYPAQDGGYIIGGTADSLGGFLMKLSSNYGLVWAKLLQSTLNNYQYELFPSGITELDDGTIIITSHARDDNTWYPLIVAFDANGDIKWKKLQPAYVAVDPYLFDRKWPYALTRDGNTAVVATATTAGQGNDIQVVKIDKDGNGCSTCFESTEPVIQVSNWQVTLESFTPAITNVTSQFSTVDATISDPPSNGLATVRCQVSGIEQHDADNPDPLQVINANGYTLLKNTGQGDVSVWIYRIDGKRMVNKTIAPAGTVHLNLPPGVYLAVTNTSATGRKLLITRH